MRRRVDWPILFGREPPVPTVATPASSDAMARLLSAFDTLAAHDDRDAVVKRAIELARDEIGLARAGIFLLDREHDLMLGSWGTNLAGEVVDEHHVMYALSQTDREAFHRAEQLSARFTVFENCPIVQHEGGETRVAGRGWVACTPIRSTRARIGMLFNDAALTGAPVDEGKQTQAAILCALLGTLLDPTRGAPGTRALPRAQPAARRLAGEAVAVLRADPSLGGKEIADRLQISLSRLARVFKTEMGMSLVEYRNRLRLDRFGVLLENGRSNLLEAALDAGFGSYAQFHRVFRALRHAAPREYLRRQN
ncbi:MAG TPA: AraC family transcriptional regulator [Polyangia bacterium]|nr:AraC family transcriptional regulator [Polyangia bacterium]